MSKIEVQVQLNGPSKQLMLLSLSPAAWTDSCCCCQFAHADCVPDLNCSLFNVFFHSFFLPFFLLPFWTVSVLAVHFENTTHTHTHTHTHSYTHFHTHTLTHTHSHTHTHTLSHTHTHTHTVCVLSHSYPSLISFFLDISALKINRRAVLERLWPQ